VALWFFMKTTKWGSRRVWCSYLYPSPLRMVIPVERGTS
jgi:hypothetical protein